MSGIIWRVAGFILRRSCSVVERITWLDFAKGVAIILVVLGHAIRNGTDLYKLIFVFHMPFFFVTAGFLLNLDKWSGDKNFRPFAAKIFKRLLVPYYVAELLWYPIWFVVCREGGHLGYLWHWCEIEPLKALSAIFIGNGNDIGLILGQLWFLPALFCAEIIFITLYNRLNKIGAEIFALTVATASCLGFSLIPLPLGVDIALVAQIFLLAGVLIRRYNVVERLSPKICGVLTLIVIVAFEFNAIIDMNFRDYGNALLFYAGGLSGTLLLMKISALMTCGKIFSLISSCGRQSMMILVLHPIFANTLYEIIKTCTKFPPEKFLTEPTIIFAVTAAGVLIPLKIAERFGKLPVLKYFCA